MRYKKMLTSAWSPQAAIDFIGDFNNLPRWDGNVKQVRQTAGDGVGANAEYHIAFVIAGDTIVMRYRTVEYEPGHRIVLEGRSNIAEATDSIHVEETAQGTQVVYITDIRVHGWKGRWLDPFLWLVFSVRVNRVAAKLQQLLSEPGGENRL